MTWLINELNRRIMFLEQVQEPQADGSMRQGYRQLLKVWASVKPVSTSAASYVRNVQVGDSPTHQFKVRRSVPAGVDTYGDGVLKSTNFVFLLTTASPMQGRLFRILTAANVDESDECIQFLAKEMGQLDVQRSIIQ